MSNDLEILSQDSKEFQMYHFKNLEDKIDLVLKKLKDTDFISIFFLLMKFLSPSKYFEIMNVDRCEKESALKKILKETREEKETLLQILVILQKYNLLKLLNSCKHKIKNKDSFDKISPLWKVLYDVSELITSSKDIKTLKQLLPPEVEDCNSPELIFIHAYDAKIFTDRDLSHLSNLFRDEKPEISDILDKYNGKEHDISYYRIRKPSLSLPCGLAVIINHDKFWSEKTENFVLPRRLDSKFDVDALKKLWEMFGFQTRVYNNLTDKEVLDLFEQLANTDHSSYDVFVSCYMSHGSDGFVFASNSKPISISDLVNIIANKCLTLLNKPKLFFTQACQGSQIQKGVYSPPVKLPSCLEYPETTRKSNTPLYSDVLKVDSTIPGYTSFAPLGKMSWFIESLVCKMKEYGKDLNMFDVMLKVQDEVSKKQGTVNLSNEIIENCKQTVVLTTTLRHRVQLKYLHT